MTDWRARAACQGFEDLFFHPEGEAGLVAQKRDVAAKLICCRCPVRDRCLEAHIGDYYGVFGGTTPQDRADLRRRRRWAAADRARLEAAS